MTTRSLPSTNQNWLFCARRRMHTARLRVAQSRRYGVGRLQGTIAICTGRKWVPIMPFTSWSCTQTCPLHGCGTVPIAAQLGESHAGVGARVGSAGPFRGCSGEGRFQQSLALPSAVRPGKAAGQRRVRPSWRVRTRPFRPSDPCSKIVLLPAPPAGFEPAHTAPEAAAPFCRICVCGLRNPVLVLRRAARQFRACSGSCSLASGAATSVT